MYKKIFKKINNLCSGSSVNEVNIIWKVIFKRSSSEERLMVDVGACRGGSSLVFAEYGWTIHAFEPDSVNREILVEKFKGNEDVHIDSRAIGASSENGVPFYTSDKSHGISGLVDFDPSHKKNGTVKKITLDEYFSNNCIHKVDFLKVDTEGYDLKVLEGLNWNKIKPSVILTEFEDNKTKDQLDYDFYDLASFLQNKGYLLIISEWFPIKKYGERHLWRRFSEYPCKLKDPQSWGNIIAVNSSSHFRKLKKELKWVELKEKFRSIICGQFK